ncbi:MAG TPA: hypothetical protein EYH06_13955 [Chromatiales bacterium]|nr:hypothetical protein [Chromatiales bacterium]
MDRRAFFSETLRKTGKAVVKRIDAKVNRQAAHWIRPPYALDELEFLLACTRCDACIEACPNQVIFPLPARYGADVVRTPALDLLNKGCHLCEEWPCVAACEPQALKLPDVDDEFEVTAIPKLAVAYLDTQVCLPHLGPECAVCRGVCPIEGAMVWHLEKLEIVGELCVGCARCREICITDPKAINIQSIHRSGDLSDNNTE